MYTDIPDNVWESANATGALPMEYVNNLFGPQSYQGAGGAFTGFKAPEGGSDDDVWNKYIGAMTKIMNTQKEKDISKLDANLASRGLSRSGNLPAGVTDIAGSYANALENFLAQTALEKAKLDQNKVVEPTATTYSGGVKF